MILVFYICISIFNTVCFYIVDTVADISAVVVCSIDTTVEASAEALGE